MLLFAALVALAVQARDTLVHLDYGTVRGVTSFSGRSRTFHNIPYAAAPIGNLRFRPPQPPKPFRGIYDPSVAGNACMVSTSLLINFKARPSEDCLNLNIISPPSAEAGDDLPVIVYVYGGGFTDGYANFPWIRGAKNIIEKEHNVIIVTVNYRVGAFGLMPSRELETEGSLNAGLHDLVAAFKWVRKNIAKFGGDPRSVTAMGLSSGGSIAIII